MYQKSTFILDHSRVKSFSDDITQTWALTCRRLSAASESQTGHGQAAVRGQPGELQETVRPAQVEGKLCDSPPAVSERPFSLTVCCSGRSAAVVQNCGFVQPFDTDHEEGPQAAWAGRGTDTLFIIYWAIKETKHSVETLSPGTTIFVTCLHQSLQKMLVCFGFVFVLAREVLPVVWQRYGTGPCWETANT